MKRIINSLFTILGAAALLTSCQQEDAPDIALPVSDRAIVCHASMPEVGSRSVATTDALDHFFLTAFDADDAENFEYFADKTLTKPEGSDKFVSDECLWPLPGHEKDVLHFFAYYPERPEGAELANGSTIADGYKINSYTTALNIADQVDLVTAYTTGTMEKNQFAGIKLDFKHQLSRVEVLAKGMSRTYKLEIAGVRFGKVPTQGNFDFTSGSWSGQEEKKVVEYIYRPGDKIVSINNLETEVSIMGGADGVNYAMLIPSKNQAWDYANDAANSNEGMYLSVLLRVLDKTPTGNDKQQYPYYDNSQGLNAMSIPRVYLAVEKSTGKVIGQVDKNYTPKAGEEVKEFGWASLPVTADWQPGFAYTYTLDYTYGMGLHGPEVDGETSPKAGDPVISDRIGVSLGFKDWTVNKPTGVGVPGN